MNPILLLLVAVIFSDFSWPSLEVVQKRFITTYASFINEIPPVTLPLTEIREMLAHEGTNLNEQVINKVLTTLKCAMEYNIERNHILTIIDYSLPSNQKRLWVFDLKEKKLLYNTYVSHGITSGTLLTNNFSNKFNSKATSLGVYKTEKAYYGREGLSLRLDGLDRSFNDNASNRSIVMHGGWYVEEPFIKRYGRPGRSWGCPALPLNAYQNIINTIKDSSLLIAYYPSDNWFGKSKFLNCGKYTAAINRSHDSQEVKTAASADEPREEVLFANTLSSFKNADSNPIVTMSANNYERIFHTKAPLGRMLRRQINHEEYIALSNKEFQSLAVDNNEGLKAVFFVVPVLKMIRGYYETQMEIVNMGTIKAVRINADTSKSEAVKSYSVSFETRASINLNPTNRFIRWLGL